MIWEQSVLFVCTGNYYRSRFAEALFNHHALERELDWFAFSRGFQPEMAKGHIAPEVTEALEIREINPAHTGESTRELTEEDLIEATLVILLKRSEHMPMLEAAFPHWTDRVETWEINDADLEPPFSVLPKIERRVFTLIDMLEDGHALGTRGSVALEF
jgi:protein-tyrosine phosphatase